MTEKIIGLKELRLKADSYIAQVKKGQSFLVMRRSRPVFRISPPDQADSLWEEVVDFTKIKRGGVRLNDLLSRL